MASPYDLPAPAFVGGARELSLRLGMGVCWCGLCGGTSKYADYLESIADLDAARYALWSSLSSSEVIGLPM